MRDRKDPIETAKTTIANVEKEMQMPGSTESVRKRQEIPSRVDRRKSCRGRGILDRVEAIPMKEDPDRALGSYESR
jgi:hypothetical protein